MADTNTEPQPTSSQAPESSVVPSEATPSTPAPDSETQARIENLNAQRSSTIEGALGDLTPADRNILKGIDTELASINPTPEKTPPYLGKAPGWDSETVAPTIANTAPAPEPIAPVMQTKEPVLTPAPKPGIMDRLKGLFVGRKPQSSGI